MDSIKKIFVINGLPRSGKTTFGEMVGKKLKDLGINFLHTSSIDPVKYLLCPSETWPQEFQSPEFKDGLLKLKREVTEKDWDGKTKDDYWRRVMSEYKHKLLENYPDLIDAWVLSKALSLEGNSVTFVDIREPESIEKFKKYCGLSIYDLDVKSVLVTSNGAENFQNKSDESVFNYNYDYEIVNDRLMGGEKINETLKDLDVKASMFIESAIVNQSNRRERQN